MRHWRSGIKAAAFAVFAAAAQAGEAQDLLFATGALEDVAPGTRLAYAYTRETAPENPVVPQVPSGRVTLTAGADSASVVLEAAGRRTAIDELPAGAGNPVFLVFMEETVRAVAALTGGSPFYIRNRLRDALASGGATVAVEAAGGAATRLEFRPFADDPNAARMRGMDALALGFVLSDAVPGRFVSLEAAIPASETGTVRFEQRMVFSGAEGG